MIPRFGQFEVPLSSENVAQIVVGVEETGVESQCSLAVGLGRVELVQTRECGPQVVVCAGKIRPEGDGLLIVGYEP